MHPDAFPPGDPFHAGLWVLRQTEHHRVGSGRISPGPGSPYESGLVTHNSWLKAAIGARSITELMGAQAPPELLGIHTNMPNIDPSDITSRLFGRACTGDSQRKKDSLYERSAVRLPKGNRLRDSSGSSVRRRCTESRTRQSAWRPISLITTRVAMSLIARVFAGGTEGPHARRYPRQHHSSHG